VAVFQGKDSSLLQTFVSYDHKKFDKIGPTWTFRTLFRNQLIVQACLQRLNCCQFFPQQNTLAYYTEV